jgi:hypothetical protein
MKRIYEISFEGLPVESVVDGIIVKNTAVCRSNL